MTSRLNLLNSAGSVVSLALYDAVTFCGRYNRPLLAPLRRFVLARGADRRDPVHAVDVVDAQTLDPGTFRTRYLRGDRPVIVRNGCADWPAVRDARWSPAKLADRFGDHVVPVQGTYFRTQATVTFREFHDRLLRRGDGEVNVPYLRYDELETWWEHVLLHFGFFSELGDNLTVAMFRGLCAEWRVPSFLPRQGHTFVWALFGDEDYTDRMPFDFGVYISPGGACTALHADGSRTHAVIAQVHGTKEAYFFPPEAQNLMERLDGTDVTYVYLRDSAARRERFPYAPVRCTLSAGDVLFVPRNWLHEVHTVSDTSVSLTFNFTLGWRDYFTSIGQVFAFGKAGAFRLRPDA